MVGLLAPGNLCRRKKRCPQSDFNSRDEESTTKWRAANEEKGGESRYPREKMLGSVWGMLCLET